MYGLWVISQTCFRRQRVSGWFVSQQPNMLQEAEGRLMVCGSSAKHVSGFGRSGDSLQLLQKQLKGSYHQQREARRRLVDH